MASLYDLVPERIPLPIRAGLVRAVRTFIAIALAAVATSIADGSLIAAIQVIPPMYAPAVTAALTTTIMGVDKWLRDRQLLEDVQAQVGPGEVPEDKL